MRSEHWIYTIPLRLRSLLRRREADQELDEELRYHLERKTEQNVAKGMTPQEARRAALLEMGGIEKRKEECRDARRVNWIHDLVQDLRYALRMLRKSPGFTAVAVLTLALGIGANTAIFTVISAVLLRPLPYKDPDRVVMVYRTWSDSPAGRFLCAPADTLDWKEQNKVFEDMAVLDWDFDPALSQAGEPVKVPGLRVSANFFSVFGVSPLLGRGFLPEEDQRGRDNVVVLSYGLWQQWMGGDPDIIGKAIRLDGESFTIVGVMPSKFAFRSNLSNTDEPKDVALWVPNPFRVTSKTLRFYSWLAVIARLKPGVSLAQAQANMEAIHEAIKKANPDTNHVNGEGVTVGVKVRPLQEDLVRDVRKPLLLLLAAVSFTVLIACVNVANLLLARAVKRQKEIGIRLGLGASRGRLIQQLLTESALLGLMGGVAGLLLASWGSRALIGLGSASLPRADTIGVDLRVLAFTLLLSLLTGVLFGLAPALGSSKPDLNRSLKETGRSSGQSLWGRRFRGLLVVGEIALSLTLLIAAGLVIKSFVRLLRVDPGFDPRNVLAIQLDLVRPQYADVTGLGSRGWSTGVKLWTLRPRRWTFVRDVVQRIRALPGVDSVAATDSRPVLAGGLWGVDFAVEGRPKPPREATPGALYRPVTADYFRVMRIPLLAGRLFTDEDGRDSQPVVIIDEALVRKYFGHEDPVGKYVRTRQSYAEEGEKVFEIVGVVGAVRESDWEAGEGGLPKEPPGVMYFPYFQQPQVYADGQMYFEMKVSFVVRAASNSRAMAASLRKAIWEVDKDQPIVRIGAMEQLVSDSVSDRHFYMLLLGIFGGLALLLAVAGIYGVVSYSVSERTHEFGLRIALGAGRTDVLKLVVGQGLILTLVGVAFGVSGAMALTRYLASFLFGVSPVDPSTFVAVSLELSAVALLASYVPARRATKVDPMIALRYE